MTSLSQRLITTVVILPVLLFLQVTWIIDGAFVPHSTSSFGGGGAGSATRVMPPSSSHSSSHLRKQPQGPSGFTEQQQRQQQSGRVYWRHQRQSVSSIQTMGLFGLGTPELVIIAAAAAFVIGPETLGNWAGQAKGNLDGDLPDELKAIPREFQKGVEEGESNARARNAKPMAKEPAALEEISSSVEGNKNVS